jgi:beta-D-xylosidase 4
MPRLHAGLNMNCGAFLANHTASAIAQGKLNESNIDESLSYLYTVLMRLGYFNGDPLKPGASPFSMLRASDVCTQEHRDLAVEAARQGIVLLKNTDGESGLPFSRNTIQTIAVIGPNANATSTMIGNYAGWVVAITEHSFMA